MKTEKQQFMERYRRQADTVYRVCYSFMKNRADAEDMTRETFLRMLSTGKIFEDERHEKAWLIIAASGLCRDALKKWQRGNRCLGERNYFAAEEQDSTLNAILQLPDEYRDIVYMYYYEGYSTVEMAQFMHCPESAVRSRLMQARKRLQILLGGGSNEK